MYCSKCGNEINENDLFCNKCGAENTVKNLHNNVENNNEIINMNSSENNDRNSEFVLRESSCSVIKTKFTFSMGRAVLTNKRFVFFKSGPFKPKGFNALECIQNNNFTFDIKLDYIKFISSVNYASGGNMEITTMDGGSFVFQIGECEQWISAINGASSSYVNTQNTNIDNVENNLNMHTTKGTAIVVDKKEDKRVLQVIVLIVCALSFYFFFFSGTNSCFSSLSDEEIYINAARNATLDNLVSPSTAIFSDEEILERDSYGRKLIYLSVDSQNYLGASVRSNLLVVILGADEDTYYVNPNYGVMECSIFPTEDEISVMKTLNNWGNPKE